MLIITYAEIIMANIKQSCADQLRQSIGRSSTEKKQTAAQQLVQQQNEMHRRQNSMSRVCRADDTELHEEIRKGAWTTHQLAARFGYDNLNLASPHYRLRILHGYARLTITCAEIIGTQCS